MPGTTLPRRKYYSMIIFPSRSFYQRLLLRPRQNYRSDNFEELWCYYLALTPALDG
ncbi:uncharacterized protein BJX67DRAFT_346627 [Aspergillus lucknowensis]|uniref:Uncharacterized protein n=1 Tax=Aspergillus lucknowensis TaxID=176173 RepID=A0ABR4LZZ1_9EURO